MPEVVRVELTGLQMWPIGGKHDGAEGVGYASRHEPMPFRGRYKGSQWDDRDDDEPPHGEIQSEPNAVPVASAAGTTSISVAAGLNLREVHGALVKLEEAGLVEGGLDGWRLTALARP